LVVDLLDTQKVYREVGVIHTSVLSDGYSSFIMAEDIGRHNTLDKISGRYLLEDREFRKKILISTGRISSDMLQKAARIGASIVVSRTSPSSLSIDLAEKWGITLVGYARRDRYNIYTHEGRIGQMDEHGNSYAEAAINKITPNI
jgi:FdhD protein